jgi:Ni,Fe-hydrogenase III large subunit/Ni,Fe-hydrogenase III component G
MNKFAPFIPKVASDVREFGDTVTFEIPLSDIADVVKGLYQDHGLTLEMIDATDERAEHDCFKVWYVLGVPGDNLFIIPYIRLQGTNEYPSISSALHGASGYERKIQSFFGLTAVGNRDQRAMILHENWPEDKFPLRKDFAFNKRPEVAKSTPYVFEKVEGEGVYELPVGPIHAGIIEPGHFRFNLAGEAILLLEGRLGYVHKGSEKLFEKLDMDGKLRLSQKISGDSSFSHSLAFCQAVEKLAAVKVPARAEFLRTIFAELERLANHFGDIGFIMLDTGYNFGGANGTRLREIIMRINERLSGSRFLRGVNLIGGVTKDISKQQAGELAKELRVISDDFKELFAIAEESDILLDRLKTAGPLAFAIARDFGGLGVPARAVGIPRDARAEHPYAAYGKLTKREVVTEQSGDVYARFLVRVREVHDSISIILEALSKLPAGPIAIETKALKLQKNAVAVGCVEGWRGEIVCMIVTDSRGEITRVTPRDPSFINWQIIGTCGQGQIVPDFPLINKSFNLSYTGNDL